MLSIVIASTFWFIGGENKANMITESIASSTPITNATEIKLTTTLRDMSTCHMTLKHQFQTYPIGLESIILIVNDFNRDSILDLAVTSYANDTFSILLGN